MFELTTLLPIIGYSGIAAIVFAESGLLIGFFLPGDSLLFTAGFLASQGIFNIWILCALSFIAAVVGDSVGYWFGHKVGPKIFQREDSLLFHKHNLVRAQEFYKKHGGKTIILARFMPVVRTFAPILAGVGSMEYSKFLTYNVVGGVLWGVLIPLLGYFLGSVIPGIDQYLIPIIVAIIVLSIMPTAYHLLRTKEDRQNLIKGIQKTIQRLRSKSSSPTNPPA